MNLQVNESGFQPEPEDYYYWQCWMNAKELGYRGEFLDFVKDLDQLILKQEPNHANR